MTVPFLGIIFNQVDDDALPPVMADLSTGAIVTVSNDATASVYPLNLPVVVNSGDAAALSAAGTGPFYKYLLRMNAQLAKLQRSVRLVVVRVQGVYAADGVTMDVNATMANILGSPAQGTGIYALLRAPTLCKVTPRLVIVPGFTGQTKFGVASPVVTNQGAKYTNPVVTFTPPGATAIATVGNVGTQATAHGTLTGGKLTAILPDVGGGPYAAAPAVQVTGGGGTATAHAVLGSSGQVASYVVDASDSNFTSAPTVTVAAPVGGQIVSVNLTSPGNYPAGTVVTAAITDGQGGQGTGATLTVETQMLANPICAALPPVLEGLKAHALVAGPGSTVQDALAWRQTLNSQRLIAQDDWEIVETIDGLSTEYLDPTARSLGLAVSCDFEHGGYPFHAWGNRDIYGILGLKRPDGFSLNDGANDGQVLLTAGIGISEAGDATDGAIDSSGYKAISVNNTSSNPLYNLYNKTRGSDFIEIQLQDSIKKRLVVKNVTKKGVDAVLDDMTVINVAIQSLDDPGIVGFKVGFKAESNTVEGLRQGKFTVYDDTEIPAPIIQITVDRGLDRDAEVSLLQQLATGITSTAA